VFNKVRSTFLGVYEAAVIGCQIAREIMAEPNAKLRLPENVPIDRALLRAIALERQRGCRRKGVTAPFSVGALADVMSDLALALLNRERDRPTLRLSAKETKKRMRDSWFHEAIGMP
jgi:hypothetical protein